MSPPLHTFKGWMATIISLWMAVLACLMGCALPALAESHAIHTSAIRKPKPGIIAGTAAGSLAERGEPEPMADMACCHHSGAKDPAKPGDGKPVPSGGMSCCPLEVTVASKWDPAALSFATTQDFVLASSGGLVEIRLYHSLEVVPHVWHSGRDTLLKTRLLRI